MNRDCTKCVYHDKEPEMGGGYYIVCDHPESTCSWPDVCPLDYRPEEHLVLDAINNTINNK